MEQDNARPVGRGAKDRSSSLISQPQEDDGFFNSLLGLHNSEAFARRRRAIRIPNGSSRRANLR